MIVISQWFPNLASHGNYMRAFKNTEPGFTHIDSDLIKNIEDQYNEPKVN